MPARCPVELVRISVSEPTPGQETPTRPPLLFAQAADGDVFLADSKIRVPSMCPVGTAAGTRTHVGKIGARHARYVWNFRGSDRCTQPARPMNVLVVLSSLNNGPCKRSGNRNGRRHHLVKLPQATALLVVPDRSGWRCCLGVGEAPRRGPSTSGSYRLHPRPSAYRGRSRLGHQLGVRSSCRSSAASSGTRVNARSTDTSASC